MGRPRVEMRRKERQKRFVCATCGVPILRANAERWSPFGPRERGGIVHVVFLRTLVQPHFCSGRCIDALQVAAGLEVQAHGRWKGTIDIYHPRGGRTSVLAYYIANPDDGYVRKRYDTEARVWKPVPVTFA